MYLVQYTQQYLRRGMHREGGAAPATYSMYWARPSAAILFDRKYAAAVDWSLPYWELESAVADKRLMEARLGALLRNSMWETRDDCATRRCGAR